MPDCTGWGRFQLVAHNTLQLLRTQRNLGVFTTGYRYLVQVIPGLVIAPLYFAGVRRLQGFKKMSLQLCHFALGFFPFFLVG